MSNTTEDPLVMYLIINNDLDLSVGKMGVSTAHAATTLALRYAALMNGQPPQSYEKLKIFYDWYDNGMQRKVVLKASSNEWKKIKEYFSNDLRDKFAVLIQDAGIVEVAPGSETCIGLWPCLKSEAPKLIKRLQTLK